MKTRVIVTVLAVALYLGLYQIILAMQGSISGSAAVGQLQDSVATYSYSRFVADNNYAAFLTLALLLFLIFTWVGPMVNFFTRHKNTSLLAIISLGFLSLGGCSWVPYNEPKFQEIAPNETAFVVPLEGASKTDQGKFMSEQFLNESKVATKRVEIPRKYIQTGYSHMFGLIAPDGYYQDTVKVIIVNRTPVSREWTKDSNGTNIANEAIYVESKESIDFYTGVVISALIREEDAAKFLYWYSGKTLEQIMDSNIRNMVQAVLAREFGTRTVDEARSEKSQVLTIAFNEVKKEFAEKGITITSLGGSGGLTYLDPQIQQVINQTFVAQNNKLVQQANLESQQKINENTISIAIAQANAAKQSQDIYNQNSISVAQANSTVAQEFAKTADARKLKNDIEISHMRAEATLELAKHSTGLPKNILPAGSPLLLGLDKDN